jgi:hypothetical protein
VDDRYALSDDAVSFADAYPFLVIGELPWPTSTPG